MPAEQQQQQQEEYLGGWEGFRHSLNGEPEQPTLNAKIYIIYVFLAPFFLITSSPSSKSQYNLHTLLKLFENLCLCNVSLLLSPLNIKTSRI